MHAPETQPSRPEVWWKRLKNWFAKIFSGRDTIIMAISPAALVFCCAIRWIAFSTGSMFLPGI